MLADNCQIKLPGHFVKTAKHKSGGGELQFTIDGLLFDIGKKHIPMS